MLVYGKKLVLEYLQKEKDIKKIYIKDGFNDKELKSLIEKLKSKAVCLPKQQFDTLIPGIKDNIILDIPDYKYIDINKLLEKRPSFIVVLDHIEDPHNLGAIIRTCEAAGVDGIILAKDRQVPVNATVMKTSVGTLYDVDICEVSNIRTTLLKLKDEGFWIVGTALDNSIDYREIDYPEKVVLVIGNEGKGMSTVVSKECDYIANIPMYGTTNSLNASVASGIMIYEIIRNRK